MRGTPVSLAAKSISFHKHGAAANENSIKGARKVKRRGCYACHKLTQPFAPLREKRFTLEAQQKKNQSRWRVELRI
jgi:cytochrome c5